VAKNYFTSLVNDVHSFQKPAFQLGLDRWAVTNILPDGAHERTPGRIQLLPNGAAGFSNVGDNMCFAANIVTGGTYKKNMQGKGMGDLVLNPSNGRRTEVCLVMVSSSSPGTPVFDNLSNIRFTLNRGVKAWSGETDGVQQESTRQGTADKNKNAAQKAGAAAAPATKPAETGISGSKGQAAQDGLQPVYDRAWLAQDSPLDTFQDLAAGQPYIRTWSRLQPCSGWKRRHIAQPL
jgi:hypothetical protein